MAFNKFLKFEIVDISNGMTARVKDYYAANDSVNLYFFSSYDIESIKPGMIVTGRSSGYSQVIKTWNFTYSDAPTYRYSWQDDFADIIILDTGPDGKIHTIVLDEVYDAYPHEELSMPTASYIKYQILDYQLDECVKQDG